MTHLKKFNFFFFFNDRKKEPKVIIIDRNLRSLFKFIDIVIKYLRQ